jgi:hypothetical protein
MKEEEQPMTTGIPKDKERDVYIGPVSFQVVLQEKVREMERIIAQGRKDILAFIGPTPDMDVPIIKTSGSVDKSKEVKNFSARLDVQKAPDGGEDIKIIAVRIEDASGVVVEVNDALRLQEYTDLESQEQSLKEALMETFFRAFQVMKDKEYILPRAQ